MPPASPHLARLGSGPRPAGGEAAAAARAYCAGVLRPLGFVTTDRPFEFSKFPGPGATPAAGVLVPALATALYAARAPLTVVAATILLVGAAAAYVGRAGVLGLPWMRARGVNLEAVRGDPTVWLVAHLDSKSQPVSMFARVAGVVITAIALVALAVAAALRSPAAPWCLVLLWVGAVPLMCSTVGQRNHGTLDNASGVAAVLHAAEQLPRDLALGIVITDAEELGLAGAHAWARGRTAAVALNCDSVDDDGPLVAMYSGRRPAELLARLQTAGRDAGDPVRVLRLIPGILTDSVALAARGWITVTLSRGTIRTLWRIHTPGDTLGAMEGRGIAGAARVLARTVTELN